MSTERERAAARLQPLTHPAFVSSFAQLDKVIGEMEAGTMPLPTEDGERIAVWRPELTRDQRHRLARATGATDEQIADAEAGAERLCEYSARHKMDGVPATTTIDCGAMGEIQACQACADFYGRMGGGE